MTKVKCNKNESCCNICRETEYLKKRMVASLSVPEALLHPTPLRKTITFPKEVTEVSVDDINKAALKASEDYYIPIKASNDFSFKIEKVTPKPYPKLDSRIFKPLDYADILIPEDKKCECGGDKLSLPHSRWCPKHD